MFADAFKKQLRNMINQQPHVSKLLLSGKLFSKVN
ncbi:Uncharacterised protein [Serratia marcescens]|jgi:hypothetical protein|nr:hypothetical protein P812_01656 [Serratia marcescens BIDMC 50]EZQ59715.1 hypothetical protein AF54_03360 [Serratia marcescens BIDMC 81]KKO58294.1 hypothetical protein LG59_881 [Serratia ureilytica]CAF2684902.1 hypothetical protein AI2887V1_1927 [Serratia marcescens]SNY83145.1 hypothetical protein SAMN06272785_1317 [Serratia sp. JKS000199]